MCREAAFAFYNHYICARCGHKQVIGYLNARDGERHGCCQCGKPMEDEPTIMRKREGVGSR